MLIVSTIIVLFILAASIAIKRGLSGNNAELQDWAHVATITGGFAAAVSIVWAATTFYSGSQLQRELTAANLYREHLELSLDHPRLANPLLPPDSGVAREIFFEEYEWYVGHALFSFEAIFDADPNDPEWKAAAGEFIRQHRNYLASDRFPCDQYTKEIRALVNKTIRPDPCPPSAPASAGESSE